MKTDQIAAEAWDEIYNANANRPQGISIIKSACEKAYQSGVDHMEQWNKSNSPRAAHASEKGAEQRPTPATASECDHQWTYAFTLSSKGEPPIKIDQCVRCGLEQKQDAHANPTPATASEKGCTCDTTGEICRPSHDCPIHGIDKPGSASAGKYKHEYADHLPATDATDHAATPSGGGMNLNDIRDKALNMIACGINHTLSPDDEEYVKGQIDWALRQVLWKQVTPSGGGEWTVKKLQGLLGISHEDRLVTDQHFENTLDEINATLRDCGNDSRHGDQAARLEVGGIIIPKHPDPDYTQRLEGWLDRLLKAVYSQRWPSFTPSSEMHLVASEIEGERIAQKAINTGEQTKEKE